MRSEEFTVVEVRAQRASGSVTVRAAAKINLHLGVGPVDVRGYHALATVYQAIGMYDDVTVADQPDWSVHLRGDGTVELDAVPVDESNIALRAARALCAHHGLDDRAARIEIHKGIPVAGGLAGGSADAAATLVALDRLWSLGTADDELLRLAAGLGSDVPFALIGGTASGLGHGEQVRPVDDHGSWWWVLVPHRDGMSTPEVYRHFDQLRGSDVPAPELPDDLLRALAVGDVGWLADQLHNDLQDPALDLRPDLQRTLDHGREAGALGTLLSGSGPTVLLLCEDQAHAQLVRLGMADRGHDQVLAAPAPVLGAHEVTYA